MTRLNNNNNRNNDTSYEDNRDAAVPGFVQGSLLNILEFDKDMLSEYGLKLAEVFRQMKEEDDAKFRAAGKELDDLFEEE